MNRRQSTEIKPPLSTTDEFAITAGDALEPDVRILLAKRGRPPAVKLDKSGLKALRTAARAAADALPLVDIGEIVEDTIAGRQRSIPVRRYLPENATRDPGPVIMFFHGGGWIAGDLDSHDAICRQMVRISGIQVIAVDYRLAPEHPFPAAFEDAIDAHRMALERAGQWNIDTARIAVMGDGTGATLAAVVAIHARDMCHPVPVAQLLFYPVADMAAESASFSGDAARVDALRKQYAAYMPAGVERADWRASPLHAYSFAGLPAAFIAVGDHDPLYDEDVDLANRLYKAGVTVSLRSLPGQIHDFLSHGAIIAEAMRSLVAAAAFLRQHLNARDKA